MVSNILKNEIYTRTLITHKKRTVNIRDRAVEVPKEEQIDRDKTIRFKLKADIEKLY